MKKVPAKWNPFGQW